jgi:hypothetical protein
VHGIKRWVQVIQEHVIDTGIVILIVMIQCVHKLFEIIVRCVIVAVSVIFHGKWFEFFFV